MSVWITRLDGHGGDGLRLAVKDAIDVAGVPTTVGCAAVADSAPPASADAACLVAARAAGARIVGKANLHELCFGTSGKNPWFGTPVNPLAPDRVPGGSSSGSAVAVAIGEADAGLGTDTGGSVRIPAACCGIVGLKTTWGRIPTAGVWPLAPSLDTVGPLARDVAGIVDAMELMEPGFRAAVSAAAAAASVVGRVRAGRYPGVEVDADLEAAVDAALTAVGLEVVEVDLPGFGEAAAAFDTIIMGEAWQSDAELFLQHPDRIGEQVRERLASCRAIDAGALDRARAVQRRWQAEVAGTFVRAGVQVLAMPTLLGQPPLLEGATGVPNQLCRPWNLAGTPAIALPIPVPDWPMPGSLQLTAPTGTDAALVAFALILESRALL